MARIPQMNRIKISAEQLFVLGGRYKHLTIQVHILEKVVREIIYTEDEKMQL